MYIPGDPLLTVLDESTQPMSVMAPLPHRSGMPERSRSALPTGATTPPPAASAPAASPAPAAPSAASYEAPAQPAEGELPRRRRRKPVSELDESAERTDSLPPRSPEETGSRWAALQRGTESGRAAAQSEPPRSPEGNAQS